MPDLLFNRLVLRGLWMSSMAKAALRYYNPRRRQAGRHHTDFYERTWREAAEQLGASHVQLAPDIAEIELDGTRTRVFSNVSAIDDPVTLHILHDKPLTHQILSEQGLPVPRHARFSLSNAKPAVEFLDATARDCVVKPASGTGGGRGVTTGIRRRRHLARAAAAAAVYGDDLMIEEQITGDNYRLLYLDGVLIDSFVRRLPMVNGDGKSSIRTLVKRHNDERLAHGAGLSQVLLTVDLDMRRTLGRQGLSLRSVPADGACVTLKTVVNENCGADNTTATQLLHPSIIEDGTRAVTALGARFAGIDIVTPDPTVPLVSAGGVILEVNGTPNLYYHYNKRDGAFPVAIHLLKRLLQPDSSGRERLNSGSDHDDDTSPELVHNA
jgi:D-alanine-D-alanine ligase-like ATP-grasp enzyme